LFYACSYDLEKATPLLQAHKVTVVSSFPLDEVIRNKDVVGRIAKWVVELSKFDVHFVSRTAIKLQVLANFVADWTIPEDKEAAQTDKETWTMSFGGALNSQGVIKPAPKSTSVAKRGRKRHRRSKTMTTQGHDIW
jgi:hypothetical protein